MISLSTAIEEVNAAFKRGAESRDTEVAMLREQVSNQASDIASLHEQLFMGRMEEMQEALAATEQKL